MFARLRIGTLLAASTAIVVCARPALSAPTPSDVRTARELFAEAEKDEDAQRWSDAIGKLRRVAEVKLTGGVRYHIALCEEHLGQLQSALADYAAARSTARDEGAQDVLRIVDKQVALLESRVPHLTLRIVPDVPETTVSVDGQPIPRSQLGVAFPVDPGVHRIEAVTPGRPLSATSVTMHEHDAAVIEVAIAAAAEEPSPPRPQHVPPPPAPPASAEPAAEAPAPPLARTQAAAESPPPRPHRTAAISMTATAAALAGGGIAFYLLAGSAHSLGVDECRTVVSYAESACEGQRTAVRAWDFAAAGAWLGAAGGATAAVFLWVAPRRDTPSADARIVVGPASIALQGAF